MSYRLKIFLGHGTKKMTKEIILPLLTMGYQGLVNTFNAVPDDKLNWKPLDNGRTALDLFADAAQTPALATMVIEAKGQIDPSFNFPTFFQKNAQERANWTKADALAAMEANHHAMIAAIEGLSEEDWKLPVSITLRSGNNHPIGFWLLMVYRSYISRFGQINYIQTLYGDSDFH
jgi:hypothetical protein